MKKTIRTILRGVFVAAALSLALFALGCPPEGGGTAAPGSGSASAKPATAATTAATAAMTAAATAAATAAGSGSASGSAATP